MTAKVRIDAVVTIPKGTLEYNEVGSASDAAAEFLRNNKGLGHILLVDCIGDAAKWVISQSMISRATVYEADTMDAIFDTATGIAKQIPADTIVFLTSGDGEDLQARSADVLPSVRVIAFHSGIVPR